MNIMARASIILFILILHISESFGADYVVNVYNTDPDLNPGDGICQSDGFYNCSLTAALQEANMDGEPSTITFSRKLTGTESISANASFGLGEDETTIDASSQWDGTWPYGRPGVELRATNNSHGMLIMGANNCRISGLLLTGYSSCGIMVNSGFNNYIGGTNPGQRNAIVPGGTGIQIEGTATATYVMGNFIGTIDGEYAFSGTTGFVGILDFVYQTTIDSNLVGGYPTGIRLSGADSVAINNTVGANTTHTAPIANQIGIDVVGNSIRVEDNFIGGNTSHGVELWGASYARIIHNNFGPNSSTPPNGGDGIYSNSSDYAIIQNNTLGNNLSNGISGIFTNSEMTGNWIISNGMTGIGLIGSNNRIGGPGDQANTINLNHESGIHLINGGSGTFSNTIQGNQIGLDNGAFDAGNLMNGIWIEAGCTGNTIGGVNAGEGNWIAWNKCDGIKIEGIGSTGNTILGNILGAPQNWAFPAPNGHHGISINGGAEFNWIGGLSGGNLILSSGWSGIAVVSSNNNFVLSNLIGYCPSMTSGNTFYGISVYESSYCQILQNFIAFNGINSSEAGLCIDGLSSLSNTISMNSIHDHSGPGIRLVNGGNGMLAPPVILSASTTHVEGTALPNSIVEIFSDSADEGAVYHMSAGVDSSGNFSVNGYFSGPMITATVTDGAMNTSEFSAPASVSNLGVGLEMPAQHFTPGNFCYLIAHLYSDQPRNNVPLFIILDVYSAYWFWPGWTSQSDYAFQNVAAGHTPLEIISSFAWPDLGSQSASGLVFWGAMLNDAMTDILGGSGGIGHCTFGYGP